MQNNSKIKVIHIGTGAYSIPPIGAGAVEKVIFFLTQNIKNHNIDVSVIDIESPEHKKINYIDFIEVKCINLYNSILIFHMLRVITFSVKVFLLLKKIFSQNTIDIIHTHSQYPGLAVLLAKIIFKWNTKLVHTCHNPNIVMRPNLFNKILNIPEIILLKNADIVIALTESVSNNLKSHYSLNPNKVICIPNGVEVDEISKLFISTRNTNKPETRILFYPARICKRKNQLGLIKALPQIIESQFKIKLILSGPEDDKLYTKKIKREIVKLNLNNFVEFTGELSREDMYKMYLETDVLVFPSLYEVQPLILIESLAFGIPSAISAIGPNLDVALKCKSALFFNPNCPTDIALKVLEILGNTDLANELSLNGKENSCNYSWSTISRKTAIAYHSLDKGVKYAHMYSS